jgi:hypothetical protein
MGFLLALSKRIIKGLQFHRASPLRWTGTAEALDDLLARSEERVLSKALTFSSAGTKYCVKTDGPGAALRGAKVTPHHFIGGGMTVHYKGRVLPVTAYGHYLVPDPAEDEKTLDVRLNAVIAAWRAPPPQPTMPSGRG